MQQLKQRFPRYVYPDVGRDLSQVQLEVSHTPANFSRSLLQQSSRGTHAWMELGSGAQH